MSQATRRWRLIVLLAVVTGGLLWGGWEWWRSRRQRRAIAEVKEELKGARHATAARMLAAFLAERPDSDEAVYLLGTCEMARGRPKAADEAWLRVPPSSSFAPQAILGRMQLRLARGQHAEAEQIVKAALDDPRIDASSLPILLGPVYSQQGRVEEAKRLIEARWDHLNALGQGASEPAIDLARLHIELQRRPIPVEAVRDVLEQAGRLAPDDDRVWLGKANLAIRVGSYDEAARWLDLCLRQHPEDVPVWRARLDWAMATNRVAEAREALKHLTVGDSSPSQIARLTAWLAARRGDRASEQAALERLIAADPANIAALDRLAELADREGKPGRAAELRRQKTEIAQLQARYEKLYQRRQPARDAAEMAHLAERLGRWFEARAFATVAVAVDPDRDDLRRDLARLNQRVQTVEEARVTLADAVAAEPGAAVRSPSTPDTPAAAQEPAPAPMTRPAVPN